MARVKLELPDNFHFATDIAIRISDINYGGHLGHDSILSLTHEARVRLIASHGFTEGDIEGVGIIIADAVLTYKSEAFYGEVAEIEIAVAEFSRYGCDFYYKISEKKSAREIARAKTGIVFYNYKERKIAPVPEGFRSIFS
ncbi:MAG: acyl-CoA thioesterase [Deltaproteobacteria bacterium]